MIFSLELLRDKGRPLYSAGSTSIAKMEKVGEHGVRFTFNDQADRELPLMLGLLPILPKHAIDAANFDKSTLKPLIGIGPYRIDSVRPGEVVVTSSAIRTIGRRTFPSKRGFDNYDEITLNYYPRRERHVRGLQEGRCSTSSRRRHRPLGERLQFPGRTTGDIVKETFKTGLPSGMFGFVLNTRRPVFQDRDVRLALGGLFDFEWANKNLFSGAYQRTTSFYDEFGAVLVRHAGKRRREGAACALSPTRVPPEIMAGTWTPPVVRRQRAATAPS